MGLTNTIANRWVFGELTCGLVGIISYATTAVRTAMLFMFAVDRFFTVFCPFAYPKYQTKIILITSVLTWVLSVIGGVIGYILDCYTFINTAWLCWYSSGCNGNCSIFNGILLVTFFVPATVIPLILYIILLMKARKAKKSMSIIMPSGAGTNLSPKTDWKATITFSLMFLTVFALALPSVIVFLIIQIVYQEAEVPATLYVLSVIASSAISFVNIMDPIVIMRNGDVREVIHNLIVLKIKRKFGNKVNQETIRMKSIKKRQE